MRKLAPVTAIVGVDRPRDALAHLAEALANEDIRGVIVTVLPRTNDRSGMRSIYCGDIDSIDAVWVGTHIMREGVD